MVSASGYQTVLSDPTIAELAGKYGVSPAQIVLAWHVARGVVAVPKSSNKERQKQNIAVSLSILVRRGRFSTQSMNSYRR